MTNHPSTPPSSSDAARAGAGADPEATRGFAARRPELAPDHFRPALGLALSSIGLGTYLGEEDDATDALYAEAALEAMRLGCNVVDCAINYRAQRSERAIGRALAEAARSGVAAREEILVATKGGYLAFDGSAPPDPRRYVEETYVRTGLASADRIAGWNCIQPSYLSDQVERSRRNLGVETIDLYYVHNPESQFERVEADALYEELTAAFEMLERKVAEGTIRHYGLATWNGFRRPKGARDRLSLRRVLEAARTVAGEAHHLRAIQLPLNLAMPEALLLPNQKMPREGRGELPPGGPAPFLDAAARAGLAVFFSAPTLQGRLTRGLPPAVAEFLPGLRTDAQRAIQFARSAPGATSALVGMKHVAHVRENLEVARVSPAPEARMRALAEGA